MLMVRAARGRGEHVPAIVPRLLGHPVTVVLVGGMYMVGVVVQGSLIWTDPLSRVLAGAVVGIVTVVVVRSIQRGAFRPRAVLEILGDSRGRRLRYSFVQAGKSGAADVQVDLISGSTHSVSGPDGALGELGSIRSATFRIGSSNAHELEVWAHSVTDEGDSLALPIAATLRQNDEETPVGLGAGDGMTSLPIGPGVIEVRIAPSQQPQIARAALDIAALRKAQEASA